MMALIVSILLIVLVYYSRKTWVWSINEALYGSPKKSFWGLIVLFIAWSVGINAILFLYKILTT
jgi:hypothetical protein